MSGRRPLAGCLLAGGLALTACAPAGASYVTAERFEVTSPHGDDEVQLPLRVTWTDTAEGEGSYLVFVDRPPIKPGGRLTDVVTSTCRRTSGCPDAAWYAQNGVVSSAAPYAVITAWPVARGRRVHTVTVVRLDRSGRRVGETAASVELLTTGASS